MIWLRLRIQWLHRQRPPSFLYSIVIWPARDTRLSRRGSKHCIAQFWTISVFFSFWTVKNYLVLRENSWKMFSKIRVYFHPEKEINSAKNSSIWTLVTYHFGRKDKVLFGLSSLHDRKGIIDVASWRVTWFTESLSLRRKKCCKNRATLQEAGLAVYFALCLDNDKF